MGADDGRTQRILTDHVFGVDIDPQAVEVTKLSLLLKVLEGEIADTLGRQMKLFRERALPNLGDNIKCGNSLIGPDYFADRLEKTIDPDELRRVNPFDWDAEFPGILGKRVPKKRRGFDAVIGNPPYVRMKSFKPIKWYLKTKYDCHNERSDLYAYFVERALRLLCRTGRFGMIVSNKFIRSRYGEPLREVLTRLSHVAQLIDFAGLKVFQGATVRTVILLAAAKGPDAKQTVYMPPLDTESFKALCSGRRSLEGLVDSTAKVLPKEALASDTWMLQSRETIQLMDKLRTAGQPLKEIIGGPVLRGVVPGLVDAFIIDQETYERLCNETPECTEILKPYLRGRDIRRYLKTSSGLYLIYAYHGVEIERYPAVASHLEKFKKRLLNRVTDQKWYELQQPQLNYLPQLEGPKIITPDMATHCRFTFDDEGYLGSNTMYFIPGKNHYLLGLLNSSVALFYLANACAALEGGGTRYLRFFGQYIDNLPVVASDESCKDYMSTKEHMAELVDRMLELHRQLHQSEGGTGIPARDKDNHGQDGRATSSRTEKLLQRQIDATDRQIDELVYELYGLTEEEIRIVEEGTG
jgi:hypothetical protein